jgi:hypothetical protein
LQLDLETNRLITVLTIDFMMQQARRTNRGLGAQSLDKSQHGRDRFGLATEAKQPLGDIRFEREQTHLIGRGAINCLKNGRPWDIQLRNTGVRARNQSGRQSGLRFRLRSLTSRRGALKRCVLGLQSRESNPSSGPSLDRKDREAKTDQ